MIRPGLALYGVSSALSSRRTTRSSRGAKGLQPVLRWKTKVVGVRKIPAGVVVGYNATFVASEPMLLALLPVGYADGLDRLLGNHFSLLVRGERAPLIGRISMDLAVIDVTGIAGVASGRRGRDPRQAGGMRSSTPSTMPKLPRPSPGKSSPASARGFHALRFRA